MAVVVSFTLLLFCLFFYIIIKLKRSFHFGHIHHRQRWHFLIPLDERAFIHSSRAECLRTRERHDEEEKGTGQITNRLQCMAKDDTPVGTMLAVSTYTNPSRRSILNMSFLTDIHNNTFRNQEVALRKSIWMKRFRYKQIV